MCEKPMVGTYTFLEMMRWMHDMQEKGYALSGQEQHDDRMELAVSMSKSMGTIYKYEDVVTRTFKLDMVAF